MRKYLTDTILNVNTKLTLQIWVSRRSLSKCYRRWVTEVYITGRWIKRMHKKSQILIAILVTSKIVTMKPWKPMIISTDKLTAFLKKPAPFLWNYATSWKQRGTPLNKEHLWNPQLTSHPGLRQSWLCLRYDISQGCLCLRFYLTLYWGPQQGNGARKSMKGI